MQARMLGNQKPKKPDKPPIIKKNHTVRSYTAPTGALSRTRSSSQGSRRVSRGDSSNGSDDSTRPSISAQDSEFDIKEETARISQDFEDMDAPEILSKQLSNIQQDWLWRNIVLAKSTNILPSVTVPTNSGPVEPPVPNTRFDQWFTKELEEESRRAKRSWLVRRPRYRHGGIRHG
eukprot:jgi/Mesvir1/26907/Mv20634-RA.1